MAELPDPEQDPEDVRELAEEILSRPEYEESQSLLERIAEAIGDFLERFLGGLGGPSAGGGSADWLAWVLLLALVVAVALLLGWAITAGVFRRRRRGRADDPAVVVTEETRPASEWLSLAEGHEAEGRWREGLLCRYRALVVALCDRDVIPELAGRTAGEYVQEVAGSPEAARFPEMPRTFAQATELFEEVWYGGAGSGPEERDRFAGLAEATLSVLESPRRSAASRHVAGVGASASGGGES